MANETRRKIVVEIEGQSKNFDKIVSDIQARLQEVGKTPSKAMEQQLKLYKAQFASLQNSLARLKDETQDIDEAAARSLHGQASRVSALVDSIITSFSRITLPPQISEQLKDLTEKLNVVSKDFEEQELKVNSYLLLRAMIYQQRKKLDYTRNQLRACQRVSKVKLRLMLNCRRKQQNQRVKILLSLLKKIKNYQKFIKKLMKLSKKDFR